jgi:hypothetical protein
MVTEKLTVAQVLQHIRTLSPSDQLDLMEQITAMLRASLQAVPTHSILELEGLGAHIWLGTRAQQYVDQERAVWDG